MAHDKPDADDKARRLKPERAVDAGLEAPVPGDSDTQLAASQSGAAPEPGPGEPHENVQQPSTTLTTSKPAVPAHADERPALRQGMMFEHYQLIRELGRGGMGAVYLARDTRLGRRVAMKFLARQDETWTARFLAEARATARCEHDNIVAIHHAGEAHGHSYMVLEHVEGVTLREWMRQRWQVHETVDHPEQGNQGDLALAATEPSQDARVPATLAVELMVSVVRALAHAHALGLVHRDLKPENIMLADDGTIKVLDFGIAKMLDTLSWDTGDDAYEAWAARGFETREGAIVGTRPYMAPEQWGTGNIDGRSDLWAVGIMLWELCAGRHPLAPLTSARLLDVANLDVPMPSLAGERPDLGPLAAIVDRCLAKRKAERMPSARALFAALEPLLPGAAPGAPATEPDNPYVGPAAFHIAPRLYGREHELATLRKALARAAGGQRQLALVTGHPGIGKSALIRELGALVAGGRGYFLEGKYDQYHRNVPYSALAQAFSVLIRQLLTEPKNRLEGWRQGLREALGPGAQVLVEVIPDLAFLIGPQPVVARLGPIETENRFNHAFQRFIEVLCGSDHPLIVFLDDLQWADAATLRLMKLMLTDPEVGHLLIIGAYRDGEVETAHPLTTTLDQLHAAAVDIERIRLLPLGLEHVRQLLADTLQRSAEDCAELAELVVTRTAGNPFFVNQFLRTLHQDRLLAFDPALHGWRWNLSAIRALGITENVVELMLGRMRMLPEQCQQVLQLAAGAGNAFDLATLAIICEDDPVAIHDQLAPAIEMSLIRPLSAFEVRSGDGHPGMSSYAFSHDRIQQAAYALIPDHERPAVHLRIARLLERALPAEERDARIFELAEHFALGAALIDDTDERLVAARLCLATGRRAKESMAHESALRFLRTGLCFMPEGSWRDHYALMRDLAMAAVEAEFLNADVDAARHLSDEILENARDLLDKVAVHDFQIVFHIARNQMVEATEVALATVSMLGIELPRDPAARAAREQPLRAELALDEAGFAALEHLPELTDRHAAAIVHILNRASTAAYFTDPPLWKLMVLTMVEQCMRHGHWSLAAMAYVQYGALLSGEYQDLERGSRFGALALRLIERFPDAEIEVKVINTFHVFVAPWNHPVGQSVEPFRAAIQRGVQTGDLEFGLYCAIQCAFYRLCISDVLDDVHREQLAYLALIERYGMIFHRAYMSIWERLTRDLLGQPGTEAGPDVLQNPFLMLHECYSRAMLHYIMGDHDAALEAAEQSEPYRPMALGMLIAVMQNFFCSLAFLSALPADPERSRDLLARVERNQAAMRRWAARVPANYAHRHALVEAERARAQGETLVAMAHYEEAIAAARTHGYLCEEALGCERAASFHATLGHEQITKMYLFDACLAYRRWGAHAKVRRLEEQHPWLAQRT